MSAELVEIKRKIDSTEAELELVKAWREDNSNRLTYILSLRAHLTELQKEKNILLARESASSASAGAPIVIFHPFI